MKYIPKFQKPFSPLIALPGGNRNINTNRPVITPNEEYQKQKLQEKNKSQLAEYIQNKKQYQEEHSDIVRNPKGEIEKIQSIGIQPTASPIDLGIGLVAAGTVGGVKMIGNALEMINPLPISYKDAYKLNPWRFKPNPNSYYRGIGRSGVDDAFESNVLRTGNKTGNYGDDLYVTNDFHIASGNYSRDQRYGVGDPFDDDGWRMVDPKDNKSYVAEIPESALKNKITTENSNIAYNKGSIPLDNVKLLKEHWLKGYKEIQKPEMVDLYRVQPKKFNPLSTIERIKQKNANGEELNWMESQILHDPEKNAKFTSRGQYHGAWYEKDPNRLDYYLADKFDESPEILQVRIPKNQVDKYSVKNLPEAQRTSLSPETEFILPENIRKGAIKHDVSKWEELKKNHKSFSSGGTIKSNMKYEIKSAKSGEKINIKKENIGKFTATKKATGKSTEELTHSKNPVTKKRAIFAQNSKRWSKKHQDGAQVQYNDAIKNKRLIRKGQSGLKVISGPTIYGARDKVTNEQLNKISGKYHPFYTNNPTNDNFTVDTYNSIWEGWKQTGAPSIEVLNEYSPLGKNRAYYMPSYNSMSIRDGNRNDYFAELAHAYQKKNGTLQDDHLKYPTREEYDRKAYNDVFAGEFKTHRYIEPTLKWEQFKGIKFSNDQIAKIAKNPNYYGNESNYTSTDQERISKERTRNFKAKNHIKYQTGGKTHYTRQDLFNDQTSLYNASKEVINNQKILDPQKKDALSMLMDNINMKNYKRPGYSMLEPTNLSPYSGQIVYKGGDYTLPNVETSIKTGKGYSGEYPLFAAPDPTWNKVSYLQPKINFNNPSVNLKKKIIQPSPITQDITQLKLGGIINNILAIWKK